MTLLSVMPLRRRFPNLYLQATWKNCGTCLMLRTKIGHSTTLRTVYRLKFGTLCNETYLTSLSLTAKHLSIFIGSLAPSWVELDSLDWTALDRVNTNSSRAPYGSYHQECNYPFLRNRRHIHPQGKTDNPSNRSALESRSQTEEAKKKAFRDTKPRT